MKATDIYLIVQSPTLAMREYEQSDFANAAAGMLQKLRDVCDGVNIDAYRGIGRPTLTPFPSLDESVIAELAERGADVETEAEARREFCKRAEAAGLDENLEIDGDELISEEDARAVYRCLLAPNEYEIIRVSSPHDVTENTLGYDVGLIARYSIICDSIVRPRWHPPAPEDYSQLVEFAQGLNKHALFPTPEKAAQFSDWYRTRPWGEEEFDSKFNVMQIETVDVNPSISSNHV